MARRVLVTGASTPLGRAVVVRLTRRTDVAAVVGVDEVAAVRRPTGATGQLAADGGRATSVADLVDAEAIDTIVHVGMCRSRSGAHPGEDADVISTVQVAAAASARPGPVRTLIAVSSTEVYPASARAATWRREDEPLHASADGTATLVLEAEQLLRDVAEREPHISVGILRLADLVGPGVSSGLTSLLRGAAVPRVPGYDPPVQFLHVDDAAAAIEHAVALELPGTFNVAGGGVVRWGRAARLAGRRTMPILAHFAPTAALLRTFAVPTVPTALVDVLRFGRCVDTGALSGTGFTPDHSTVACVAAIDRSEVGGGGNESGSGRRPSRRGP